MDATESPIKYTKQLECIRREREETVKRINLLKAELWDVTKQLEDAGVGPDSEILDMRLSLGRKKFNNNPKTGLEFMFENEILERSPFAVAQFFHNEKLGLSKAAIGAYLGEISKDFNMQVLDEFLKLHDFDGLEFLPALRQFLLSFQLPGESQKIDRILASFGQQYVLQNPTVFRTSHEAYVMAYAAILLNTTLHNCNAKNQTNALADEKTFVRTMLEFDKDTNLSEDIIKKVFHGIKSKPLQVVEEAPELSILSGWLWKLGGHMKSWQRRWFVLTEDKLLYYTAPERTQRKGIIALENVSVRRTSDRSRDYCFELFSRRDSGIDTRKSDREGVVSVGYHTTYRMAAGSAEEYEQWVSSLQLITDRFGYRRGASVPCFPNRQNSSALLPPSSSPTPPPPPPCLPSSVLPTMTNGVIHSSSSSSSTRSNGDNGPSQQQPDCRPMFK